MISNSDCKKKFKQLKCCVLIPTYNNDKTIVQVIRDCKEFIDDVIVVVDGATDNTLENISPLAEIDIIKYFPNKGKGTALKLGFKHAEKKGFDYAISIDSDGQHLAKDLPSFLAKIEKEPGALIVGERNMDQNHIPGGSSFGHKFSNFWYWAETGIKLPDTQSGFRLYPVRAMNKIWFFTGKYEFEIENIVKAAWKGINVTSVPISVVYQQGEDRVTHFRPYDFFRISLLNTYLFVLALLIYHPIRFIKGINKKNIERIFREEIVASDESNLVKSISVGFGFFMGIVPLWGFQFALALLGAFYFRLNKVIVGVTANISVPPMIPVIIYASYLVGGLFMKSPHPLIFSREITLEAIHTNFMQYLVGAIVLSIGVGVLMGLLTYGMLLVFRPKSNKVH